MLSRGLLFNPLLDLLRFTLQKNKSNEWKNFNDNDTKYMICI
jgi:hypothetical protein